MTDLLAPLIDAYRAENSPASLDARALRSRILVAAARRQQNPLRRVRFLLVPIAAAFLATGALAATPSTHPALVRFLANLTHAFRSPAPPPRAPTDLASPPRAPAPGVPTLSPHPDLPRPPTESLSLAPSSSPLPAPAPAPAPAPSAPLGILELKEAIPPRATAHPPAARAPSSSPPSSPSASASASASAPAPAPASPTPATLPPALPPPPLPPPAPDLSPDLSAYGVAHRLHFAEADYPRALAAWTGYLARFPAGTFAPEARLNRAVCLARVGRIQEARAALTSIASGKYGAYGRAPAQQLLDALSGER